MIRFSKKKKKKKKKKNSFCTTIYYVQNALVQNKKIHVDFEDVYIYGRYKCTGREMD